MVKYGTPIVSTCVTLTFIVVFISGCPRSPYENFTDEELFKEFLQDQIPESVEAIRVCRPNARGIPIYVFSFKVNDKDFETIRKTKPFVLVDPNKEESYRFNPSNAESFMIKRTPWDWGFDANSGELSWETPLFDVNKPLSPDEMPGKKYNTIYPGSIQSWPNWFELDRWREVQFYAYEENWDPNNPSDPSPCIDHILIYNEKLSEAYYIRRGSEWGWKN